MLEALKQEVFEANQLLPRMGLVKLTWGNVSGKDRKTGLVVIKPSGVAYENMQPADLVVVDPDGNCVEGTLNPSSDLATHLVLYRNFPEIAGVVHTHSQWATIWAQSGLNLPVFGTTHADYFDGEIPCSRTLNEREIGGEYEKETGNLIVETFQAYDYRNMPGILVRSHGPFTWGNSAQKAVENAFVLEEVAQMAYHTLQLNPRTTKILDGLLKKHYYRKHGVQAYYGQEEQAVTARMLHNLKNR